MVRMGLPDELPPALRNRALTRKLLASYGLGPQRLRSARMVPLGSGVYLPQAVAEGLGSEALHVRKARAIAAGTPEARLSHVSAAMMHGLWLPARLSRNDTVHLTYPPDTGRLVRSGVQSHRCEVRPGDMVRRDGISVSSPVRTWLELAALCSRDELVVLGDQLVRKPYGRYEGRSRAYASVGDLREALDAARRFRGRRRALDAVDLVRGGSDSPPETLLRLALVAAGLPEPELQIPLHSDGRGRRGDMGYRQVRVVIQYEGAVHFNAAQIREDHQRDNEFLAEGWMVLRFNVEDFRDGFRNAAAVVRKALAERALSGTFGFAERA